MIARVNLSAWSELLSALIDGPCSVAEMVEASGLSTYVVRNWVAAQHRRRNLYIAAWERDRQFKLCIRVYALGRDPDVRKPPAISRQPGYRSHVMRVRSTTARLTVAL